MRRVALLTGWILLGVTAMGWAAPIKTQEVTFPSGDETIAGYLAMPDAAGQHPALVVIHEWWGLNDWVKEQARKLAEQGYVALAVDLYRGEVTYDPSLADELMRSVPRDRAIRDLKAGFDYLAARPEVKKEKIGALGWCMGGEYSLQLAINEPRLAACVVNYGALPTDPADIRKIQAPMLGNFGADDRDVPQSAVESFEKAMNAANRSVDLKIYPGAGHAFENPGNKLGYRELAAHNAWERTLTFLDHNLK
jgi:carboxymethylenebutenolidase